MISMGLTPRVWYFSVILPLTALCHASVHYVPGDLPTLVTRQVGPDNCTSPSTGRSNACWADLHLTDWLEKYLLTHPCKTGEGFSTCLLRQLNISGIDCSGVSTKDCDKLPGALSKLSPEANYVAYNIYSINEFFSSWYQADGQAAVLANQNFDKLVQILNPPQGPSQYIQKDLANLQNLLRDNLRTTLASVMANSTEFIAFAEQGNFSDPSSSGSLEDKANYLKYAFNTFLVSEMLSSQEIYAVIGVGTNPQALATNGSVINPTFALNCSVYDEHDLCDAWWYSQNYASAFSLDNFNHPDRTYHDILVQILTNYTSGELLFEGAYECNAQGNFGNPTRITVNAGGVNTACISNMKVLTWDMTCRAGGEILAPPKSSCEFLEQPSQPGFFLNTTIAGEPYFVPAGYLGPALTQNKVNITRVEVPGLR